MRGIRIVPRVIWTARCVAKSLSDRTAFSRNHLCRKKVRLQSWSKRDKPTSRHPSVGTNWHGLSCVISDDSFAYGKISLVSQLYCASGFHKWCSFFSFIQRISYSLFILWIEKFLINFFDVFYQYSRACNIYRRTHLLSWYLVVCIIRVAIWN